MLSDNRRARAQDKRRRDTTPVSNATGRDDGNVEVISQVRNEREETDALPFSRRRVERAAVTTCLAALGENGVGPCALGCERLL
jgi:ssDNA-binding replication factor A large subunit